MYLQILKLLTSPICVLVLNKISFSKTYISFPLHEAVACSPKFFKPVMKRLFIYLIKSPKKSLGEYPTEKYAAILLKTYFI